MIRTSKHILKYQTKHKNNLLDELFYVYLNDINICIDSIINNNGIIPKFGSSNGIIQHSRWKQIVYKNASEIIRSQLKQAEKRRYNIYKKIYAKCIKHNKCLWFTSKKYSELNLKPIYKTKYFHKPDLKNITITLDERVIDFKEGNCFDEFIRIRLPFFEEEKHKGIAICIPFKHHKHSLRFNTWNRKKSVRLLKKNNKYFLELIYEKESEYKNTNQSLGLDQGYKKLLSCSDNSYYGKELNLLYDKIANKVRGSKKYKKLITHKNNEINRIINTFIKEHKDISDLYIEDLLNVKYKSKLHTKLMNKLQYWTYGLVKSKLENICEMNGIRIHYVEPSYTSQTCSKCGYVDKLSRDGEIYHCRHCGLIIDADYNASINILHRGVYSPSILKIK